MGGYEIEFFSEIGKRRLWFDTSDYTPNIEELNGAAEERIFVCVEPETFVTKQSTEVEKVTGSATEVENLQRGRTIKPEVLRASDVHANPIFRVFVSIDFSRIWPVGIALAQSL